MTGNLVLKPCRSTPSNLGNSALVRLSELTRRTPTSAHPTVAITVIPCDRKLKWWTQCFNFSAKDASVQPKLNTRLSLGEVKDLQLRLQQQDAALQTAEKENLTLKNMLTLKTLSYATETKIASAAAAHAFAAIEATLAAVKKEAVAAVLGRKDALAALQAEVRRSIHSNAEAQSTITRMSSEQLERVRQAETPSPQTRIALARLRKVQNELADSKELAATTLTFAEQLQGFFEQSQACAADTAKQGEVDRRKIEQLTTKTTYLNFQLTKLRRAAEVSGPELLAQSAALLAIGEQLHLSECATHTATKDRDIAVAQIAKLQQKLDRALTEAQKNSGIFTREKATAIQMTEELNALLADKTTAVQHAQAPAPEMGAMPTRMLGVQQQLRNSCHIAHCVVVSKDAAEASTSESLPGIKV